MGAEMDTNIQTEIVRRLNRIEGQVRGLKQMVEQERYCVDVLTQIASVHEALRGVGRVLMRNHLDTCVTEGLREGDAASADRIRKELLDIMLILLSEEDNLMPTITLYSSYQPAVGG